jgi:hypothetical protein
MTDELFCIAPGHGLLPERGSLGSNAAAKRQAREHFLTPESGP